MVPKRRKKIIDIVKLQIIIKIVPKREKINDIVKL